MLPPEILPIVVIVLETKLLIVVVPVAVMLLTVVLPTTFKPPVMLAD
jgi:hypothetical protein